MAAPFVTVIVAVLVVGSTRDARAQSATGQPAGEPALYFNFYPGGTDCPVPQIWRSKLDGSSPELVVPDSEESAAFDVSRDGRYIVRELTPALTSLFLYDLQTGAVRPLARGSLNRHNPRFSPDGRSVAFLRSRTGIGAGAAGAGADLMVVPTAGGSARVLARNVNTVTPSWSADGARIAYQRGSSKLMTVSASGGRSRVLVGPSRSGAYAPLIDELTWTSTRGVLYSSRFGFSPSRGGSRHGLPVSGLYLASTPSFPKGRLVGTHRTLFGPGYSPARFDPPHDMTLLEDGRLVTELGGKVLVGDPAAGRLHALALRGPVRSPRVAPATFGPVPVFPPAIYSPPRPTLCSTTGRTP